MANIRGAAIAFGVITATLIGASGHSLAADAPSAYDAQINTSICGFLPYRSADGDRFAKPRTMPAAKAKIGRQATYPFAWDLARPSFLAAEVAEDLLEGTNLQQVRQMHGASLSLGEYMLDAAKEFQTPPATTPDRAKDIRVALAAERPITFHRIYAKAKIDYDAIVAAIDAGAEDNVKLAEIALAWRSAYALIAKAHADDKRIELLDTNLDADQTAEKEAVACLAHAVALAAGEGATVGSDAVKAAAARWATRPAVNARTLDRGVRGSFFDYEDAGDDLAAAIAELPSGPIDLAAMRGVAKTYSAFVAASKSFAAAEKAAQ